MLPTRVGMVRETRTRTGITDSAPHTRGDGPINLVEDGTLKLCSPPAWGWSGFRVGILRREIVLPTRVGMVRHGMDR